MAYNVARVCEVALEDKGFLVRKSNFANPLIGDVGSALARTRLSAGVTRATIGRNCERSEQFPSYRWASATPLSRTLGALLLGGACHPAKRCGAANFVLFPGAFLHDLAHPHPCADALLCNVGGP